jgi:hypothetical protein
VLAEAVVAEPAVAEFEDAGGAEEMAEDGAAIEIAAALDALEEPEESSDLELGTMDMGADFKAPTGALLRPVAMAAAAGPPKAPAPAGVRLASLMKGSSREARSRGGRREDATAESTLRARDDMLAYGNLRMPPARSAERGHLVVTDRLHLYLELFVEREIEVRFDVAQAVTRATRRADGAGQTLPARHHLAVSDDGFDYAYVAETPADIPSDRHYHSIPLVTRTAPAGLRHVAVPRESTDVFRVARFENPLPGPLLPGPADVSFGDEFLVTTDVAATPAGAAVTLGLGVDQAVKVSRNTHFREETKGLTRGSLALAHQIAIGVQSHAPHPIQLEVRERVPTTQKDEKEIEVELGEVTPDWQPWEPEAEAGGTPLKGGHRWLVSLAAGEKKELRAAYRVRISSKHELVGGNRRERG